MCLAMTTNERMNAGRYKHFHVGGRRGEIRSPFNRGVIQNLVDVTGMHIVYALIMLNQGTFITAL